MDYKLKVRVWNGEYMISPDYVDRKGFAHWYENSIPEMSDKLILFTGVQDMEEEDVYHGDIVQAYPSGDLYEVKWGEYWAIVNISGAKAISFYFHKVNNCATYTISNHVGCQKFKIIGNIYQNPELLNK